MTFDSFNFDKKIDAGIKAAGYETPTPIQVEAIPVILQGRDIVGLAQTGTGKTAVFMLPILQRLLSGPKGVVRALIIAPTRELAEQINQATILLGKQTRLRSVTVYGGVNIKPQIKKLREGVEIVIACPGRLLDHMGQGTIDLTHVEVLVLDEADRMFDMGFLPDLRRILNKLPGTRQNLMFSATMPQEIQRLTNDVLRNPVKIHVSSGEPPVTVKHVLYPVEAHLKNKLLLKLLHHTDTDSVLIFARTKIRANRLSELLTKEGYNAACLQGNMTQSRRTASLNGFRDGTFPIMVATDIAARGIDVTQISHVINYDMPDTVEAYTHRIGRTGRAARTGDAFTFVTPEDEIIVKAIERFLGYAIERVALEDFDYKVPAKLYELEKPVRRHGPAAAPFTGKKSFSPRRRRR